jgi:hypothetical protein
MNMPRFAAEASLYKTTRWYSGYSGIAGLNTASAVVAADANSDCIGICLLAAEGAAVACAWSGPGIYACLLADVLATWACVNGCPPPSNGGGGGGGPPPPLCCPPGTQCKCGGKCVMVGGRLTCVDGECLGPRQQCR